MAIFNSYVSLPEGTCISFAPSRLDQEGSHKEAPPPWWRTSRPRRSQRPRHVGDDYFTKHSIYIFIVIYTYCVYIYRDRDQYIYIIYIHILYIYIYTYCTYIYTYCTYIYILYIYIYTYIPYIYIYIIGMTSPIWFNDWGYLNIRRFPISPWLWPCKTIGHRPR